MRTKIRILDQVAPAEMTATREAFGRLSPEDQRMLHERVVAFAKSARRIPDKVRAQFGDKILPDGYDALVQAVEEALEPLKVIGIDH